MLFSSAQHSQNRSSSRDKDNGEARVMMRMKEVQSLTVKRTDLEGAVSPPVLKRAL